MRFVAAPTQTPLAAITVLSPIVNPFLVLKVLLVAMKFPYY
jgi:hypothetical protein